MITCSVWWATPVDDTAAHRELLTDVELDRFGAYVKPADRRRFLTGRVLAKTVVARHLGRPARDVVFDASCDDCDKQHGPPRVPGSDLELSISHSGERIGLALTPGAKVGLDVEATTRRADDGLLEEALMKATGKGLRIPLTSLTLSAPGMPPRLVSSEDPALAPDTARLAALSPGEGYDASVAVLTGEELDVTENWWSPAALGH
ncbi:4'-phosphopantetheinyl transferase [Streptomyces regensis]|nr:4'-phosphopantetheinyl transferase [Streptomyces regensis]